MKAELRKRLKSYSIAAGAVLSAGAAKSAVVYTDVNPDQTFSTSGGFYLLDLNNDMTSDFKVTLSKFGYSSFSFVSIYAQGFGSNEIASSSYYAQALNANAQVNAALAWGYSSYLTMGGRFFFTSSSYSSSFSFGNWINVTDKYLGLKLRVGANTYYGWARLDVNVTVGSFTIKDYAYDNTTNQSILTGVIPADQATSINGKDVGGNSNGSDLQVSFTKAANEATVSEYRVIIVKNSAVSSFNLSVAQAVPSANYTMLLPNGSNVVTTFAANAKDSQGDPIVIGLPYRIFVLSKADGIIRTIDGLSNASNSVTLNTTAGFATSLFATDAGNLLNSNDMQVAFDRATNEAGIAEYRVIVLNSADAPAFNLAAAKAVAFPNYTSITPTGGNIIQNLPAFTFDNKGTIVSQNIPYKFFVLSVANGTMANIDTLSSESNVVILTNTIGVAENNLFGAELYSEDQSVFINTGSFNGLAKLVILDNTGRRVFEDSIEAGSRVVRPHLTGGIYYAELEMEGRKMIKRIYLN